MTDYERAVVAALRHIARKAGMWDPGKEDMQIAADLIENLCAERDKLAGEQAGRNSAAPTLLRCFDTEGPPTVKDIAEQHSLGKQLLVVLLKNDIEKACIKRGLNLTVYNGRIAFVDQERARIIALWNPQYKLKEKRGKAGDE